MNKTCFKRGLLLFALTSGLYLDMAVANNPVGNKNSRVSKLINRIKGRVTQNFAQVKKGLIKDVGM